jgi:hypothetical protein
MIREGLLQSPSLVQRGDRGVKKYFTLSFPL